MTDDAVSPLRRRMIQDMTIRKFVRKTQHDYVQRVKNFAAFLGRSPDTASFEDVRRYQLHLVERGSDDRRSNTQLSSPIAQQPSSFDAHSLVIIGCMATGQCLEPPRPRSGASSAAIKSP